MEFNVCRKVLILSLCISVVYSLECYVCTNQDSNNDKCLRTIGVCEQGQDVCMTEVKWGTMPYWQQGADKQYYVTKSCATKAYCEKHRRKLMQYCTHIWYQDWQCSECCQGDRCNYYVILGASSVKSSYILLLITGVIVYTINHIRRYQN